MSNPTLDRLRSNRQDAVNAMESLLAQAEERGGSLSDAERAQLDTTRETLADLDEQINPLAEFENLRETSSEAVRQYASTAGPANAPDGARSAGARTEDRGYEYNTRGEVLADLVRVHPSSTGAEHPAGKHYSRSVDADQARERLMGARVPFTGAPDDYQRAVSNEITGDVPGLLPKQIVGAVDNDLDAARPFVQSIGARDLGSIPGKTFTRPTITQHATAGQQTTEKSEVPSRKMTVGGVDFTKETYGGALDVSRQTMDWTSPAAWDALLNDLQDQYGIVTESAATAAFNTAVTQSVELAAADPSVDEWITALYEAAALSYGGAGRLPDRVWVSLDRWAQIGAAIDQMKASTGGTGGGDSSPGSFAGNMLAVPRVVVPSLPDETVIVGVSGKTEFYEQRIGLLSAVEPALLGVEIAYGGYVAYGTIRAGAFAKIVAPVA